MLPPWADEGLPVQLTTRVLGVSESGHYEWRGRAPSRRDIRHARLIDLIRQVHADITEHPTREGKVYCCVVLDAYSRRVVDWPVDASRPRRWSPAPSTWSSTPATPVSVH
jgi:hypothetical protein